MARHELAFISLVLKLLAIAWTGGMAWQILQIHEERLDRLEDSVEHLRQGSRHQVRPQERRLT